MSKTKIIALTALIVLAFGVTAIGNAVAQQPKTIIVTIERLEAKSVDACNKRMDFYGMMVVNGKRRNFNNIVEGNRVYPNWYVNTWAKPSMNNEIFVKIMDEDDLFCGGDHDLVDINPESGIAELFLLVAPASKRVYNASVHDSKPEYIGKVGKSIMLEGFDQYTSFTPAFGRYGKPVRGSKRNVETGRIVIRVDFYY